MLNPASRSVLRVTFEPSCFTPAKGVRPVQESDRAALGQLMYHAYLGTVDYEGETEEQAAAEIARTFAGAYGTLNAAASQVFEQDGRILSATLITTWQQRPFVAFSMTHPEAKNRGLARACMRAAMGVLASQGHRELRLVITRVNAPALALYTRLGFEVEREH